MFDVVVVSLLCVYDTYMLFVLPVVRVLRWGVVRSRIVNEPALFVWFRIPSFYYFTQICNLPGVNVSRDTLREKISCKE